MWLKQALYWIAYCCMFLLVMLILVWPAILIAIALLGPSFKAMNP